MRLAMAAITALGVVVYISTAYASSRALDVIHCEEAWNVMSPEGLAPAHELAGQHLVGVPQVDLDADGEITRVEFLDRCVAGDIKVVVDFPCCG
jgi:hypothetical protein